jgi:preprotein translocase subunit SecA
MEQEQLAGSNVMRHFEKALTLQILDTAWKEHLGAMDYLRQGIGLRSYAQKNPKQEYKREAFAMFTDLLERIKTDVATYLSTVRASNEQDVEAVEEQRRRSVPMEYQHATASALEEAGAGEGRANQEETQVPFVRSGPKVGRNEPCPCGSGKKYKHCHGKLV